MERAFKGIWIPAEIWLNKELTLLEKVFLVEIDSLDNDNGCFATNDYFSKFFKLSKSRCSEIINSLEKKGLIKITFIYKSNTKTIEKRIIKVLEKSNRCIRNLEGGIRNLEEGIRNLEEGYSENTKDNNTVFNNTINIYTTQSTQNVPVVNINKELIESKTHLILDSKNKLDKIENWNKDRLLKAIEIFIEQGGEYFSLLEKIYKDDKNFISKKQQDNKKVLTRFHNNCNQTFTKYTEKELEELLLKSQEGKFN